MLSRLSRLFLAAWLCALWLPGPANADAGKNTALHITTAAGRVSALSVEELRRMETRQISTSTIWTEGTHEFTGVPLRALLLQLEASGQTIRAVALNDYAVTIPFSDARADSPIIAFEMDGKPLPRRGKGPLWLIYPFDAAPEFRTETVYSRSIWQLNRLIISK